MKKSFLLFISLIFLASITQAADKDYSIGFEKLYQLGLHDVKDAEYISLQINDYSFHSMGYDSGYGFETRLKTEGNAWLIKEDPQAQDTVIYQNRRINITNMDRSGKPGDKDPSAEEDDVSPDPDFMNTTKKTGTWKKVDLEKEIDKILNFLDAKDQLKKDIEYVVRSQGSGQMFLFAAQIYRKGYKKQASQIITALFGYASDPRIIIVQALNLIADAQYLEIYDLFLENNDWELYSENINMLLNRFPQGWKKQLAVRRLYKLVHDRAFGDVPGITGDNLGNDDRELAKKLAAQPIKESQALMNALGDLWVLDNSSPGHEKKEEQPDEKKTGILAEITTLGVKAVPLLTALLKDNCMTSTDMSSIRTTYLSISYDLEDEITEEAVNIMFKSMRRPATRSDIAYSLLMPLVIPEKRENSFGREEINKDDLFDKMTSWYSLHKESSSDQLAKMYFEKGSQKQKLDAFNYLLKSDITLHRPFIEAQLLKFPSAPYVSELAMKYAKATGTEAADFAELYLTALKEEIKKDPENTDESREKAAMKRYESTAKLLHSFVRNESVEDLIGQIGSGKSTLREISGALWPKLAEHPTKKIFQLVLESAIQTEALEQRLQLLYLMNGIVQAVAGGYLSTEKNGTYQARDHADLWDKLLSDESLLPGKGMGTRLKIKELSACIIEAIETRKEIGKAFYLIEKMGKRGSDFICVRARARVNGVAEDKLPKWPSADMVKPEKLEQIVQKIESLEDDELAVYIRGLGNDELLGLQKDLEPRKDLFPKLVKVANKIVSAQCDCDDTTACETILSKKGTLLTNQSMKELLDLGKSLAENGKQVYCIMTRDPMFEGLNLEFTEIRDKNKETLYQRYSYFRGPAFRAVIKTGPGYPAEALWVLKINKPGTREENGGTAQDDELESDLYETEMFQEQQDKFWKSAEKAFSDENNPFSNLSIYFEGGPNE